MQEIIEMEKRYRLTEAGAQILSFGGTFASCVKEALPIDNSYLHLFLCLGYMMYNGEIYQPILHPKEVNFLQDSWNRVGVFLTGRGPKGEKLDTSHKKQKDADEIETFVKERLQAYRTYYMHDLPRELDHKSQ